VKVGEWLRSVTFSFELRDPSKTITDEEALAIQQKIITNLERDGIKLRWN
jgi:phenylalanyl-tRNA synthetase beta subunit